MKEVYVFGTDKFELIRGLRISCQTTYPTKDPPQLSHHAVRLFNEKTGMWEIHPCNETVAECPVCGTRVKAYYIPGTTWVVCCSEECGRKLLKKAEELGSLIEAIGYFMDRRR